MLRNGAVVTLCATLVALDGPMSLRALCSGGPKDELSTISCDTVNQYGTYLFRVRNNRRSWWLWYESYVQSHEL